MGFRLGLKFIIITITVMAGFQLFNSPTRSVSAAAPTTAARFEVDPTLAQIAEYKQWSLVNPTPQLMEAASAQLCAAAVNPATSNPHLNKYISVYVNAVGASSLLSQSHPHYPVGTIVVKEKLPTAESKTPELLTAMVKREAGFDPTSGDWEYLVLDGAAAKITRRGKLASCNACHTAYKDQDFITRSYLPAKTQLGLK